MVAAVESEAVERALVRVLKGPVVEEAVNGALESETVKRALIEALDSELVDEVWLRLLASEETQRLVERIAEAPEIRAAISAQSVGFIGTSATRSETRPTASTTASSGSYGGSSSAGRRAVPTQRVGAVTRALALGLDVVLVNLVFSGLAAITALIVSAFTGGNGVSELRWPVRDHRMAGVRRRLSGRLLVARRTDPGYALRRDQAECRRPRALVRTRGEPPDRPQPLDPHPRDRLPRHHLRRAAPRLGGPACRHRRRLRGGPPEPAPWSSWRLRAKSRRPRRRRSQPATSPRSDEGPGSPGPSPAWIGIACR